MLTMIIRGISGRVDHFLISQVTEKQRNMLATEKGKKRHGTPPMFYHTRE